MYGDRLEKVWMAQAYVLIFGVILDFFTPTFPDFPSTARNL
jgi:hypothetical protein